MLSGTCRRTPHYGIQDNEANWFRSYLSKRKRFVSVNGTDSDLLEISTGAVPQGSILDLILFLIYANEAQFISRLIDLVLYADDMNILVSHKNSKFFMTGCWQID